MSALSAWSQEQKQSRSWSSGLPNTADLEVGRSWASQGATGMFSSVRDTFVSTAHDYTPVAVSGAFESTTSSIRNSIETVTPPSAERLQWFAIFLGVGVLLLFLSFAFLPMVVLNPRKFALLFTGGMTSIVASTVSLRGMAPLFSFVSAKERLPFAIAYAFAYFGTLYASLVMRSYFLTIVCIVAEVVSMLYLVLSYVPGGARFLNFVFATALSFCRVCLSRCMKMSSSGEEASSGSGGRGGILGL